MHWTMSSPAPPTATTLLIRISMNPTPVAVVMTAPLAWHRLPAQSIVTFARGLGQARAPQEASWTGGAGRPREAGAAREGGGAAAGDGTPAGGGAGSAGGVAPGDRPWPATRRATGRRPLRRPDLVPHRPSPPPRRLASPPRRRPPPRRRLVRVPGQRPAAAGQRVVAPAAAHPRRPNPAPGRRPS